MELQEIFNKAFNGVVTQGKPAYALAPYVSCRYETPDGTHCVFGHVMKGVVPAGHSIWAAEASIEELSFHDGSEIIDSILSDEDARLMSTDMQALHDTLALDYDRGKDSVEFVHQFKEGMNTIAQLFGLKVPC